MKCSPDSRNLVAAVLVLLLAASAPAALALPAGPGAGGGAGLTWDLEGFFGWVEGLLGGFFGGAHEVEGPSSFTDKARTTADPNGNDLTVISTGAFTDDAFTQQVEGIGR